MSFIQTNFKQGLDALNRQAVSEQHVLLPNGAGRAYKFDQDNTYYGDEIHFFSMSEEHHGRVRSIKNSSKTRGGIYAGTAGMLNLSYMGALEASAGILFDLNPFQKIFWEGAIKLMAEHANVRTFKAALPRFMKEIVFEISALHACANSLTLVDQSKARYASTQNPNIQIHNGYEVPGDNISEWYKSKRGDSLWQEFYPHLHQMAKNNAIGAITLDVCDVTAVQQLRNFLDRAASIEDPLDVDYLYISNIFNFLNGSSDWSQRPVQGNTHTVEQAKKNLSLLLTDESIIFSQRLVETNHWKTILVSENDVSTGYSDVSFDLN